MIEPHIGKLILNHLIVNNCPEFRNGLLDLLMFQVEFRKSLLGTFFLDIRFQSRPDSVLLRKYQSLSNDSFKHNLGHMLSLNLTPKISFEPTVIHKIFETNSSFCVK